MKKIFISYSWKDSNEVEKLDEYFRISGITLIRDIRNLKYMENAQEFMDKVEKSDYVITLMSKDYFLSENCMYEFMKIWDKENLKNKIMLLNKNDFKISNSHEQEFILKFWNEEINKIENLKEKKKFYEKIERFLNEKIKEIGNIRAENFFNVSKLNYQAIFNFIGFNSTEIYDELFAIIDKENNEEKEIGIEKFYIKYPESKYSFLLKGLFAIQEGKNELAKFLFKELLLKDDKFIEGYVNLGAILSLDNTKYKEAEKYFLKALELEPENPSCCFNYAGLLEKMNSYNLSKEYYLKAINFRPTFDEAYFNLGILLEEKFFDKKEAIQYYNDAIKYNGKKVKYFLALANLTEDINLAKSLYEKALKIEYKLSRVLNVTEELESYSFLLNNIPKIISEINKKLYLSLIINQSNVMELLINYINNITKNEHQELSQLIINKKNYFYKREDKDVSYHDINYANLIDIIIYRTQIKKKRNKIKNQFCISKELIPILRNRNTGNKIYIDELIVKAIIDYNHNGLHKKKRNLVLVGDSGVGKTTMAFYIFDKLLNELEDLVIYISLRDVNNSIEEYLKFTYNIELDKINYSITRLILILDAFNEIKRSIDSKRFIKKEIEMFSRDEKIHIVLTSKVYETSTEFPLMDDTTLFDVDILTDEQIKNYALKVGKEIDIKAIPLKTPLFVLLYFNTLQDYHYIKKNSDYDPKDSISIINSIHNYKEILIYRISEQTKNNKGIRYLFDIFLQKLTYLGFEFTLTQINCLMNEEKINGEEKFCNNQKILENFYNFKDMEIMNLLNILIENNIIIKNTNGYNFKYEVIYNYFCVLHLEKNFNLIDVYDEDTVLNLICFSVRINYFDFVKRYYEENHFIRRRKIKIMSVILCALEYQRIEMIDYFIRKIRTIEWNEIIYNLKYFDRKDKLLLLLKIGIKFNIKEIIGLYMKYQDENFLDLGFSRIDSGTIGETLYDFPSIVEDSPKILVYAIKYYPMFGEELRGRISIEDIEIIKEILRINYSCINYIDKKYKSNFDCVYNACLNNGKTLIQSNIKFRNNLNIINIALTTYPSALFFLNEKNQNDESILKNALNNDKNNEMFSEENLDFLAKNYSEFNFFVKIEFIKESSMIKKIIFQNPNFYFILSKEQRNKDNWYELIVVSKDGLLLSRLEPNYTSVFEIVLEAVKNNGLALKYASDELKNNGDIVLEAVKNKSLVFLYASDRLKNDVKFTLASVRINGSLLKYLSKDLTSNQEIVRAAVRNDGFSLRYASKCWRYDFDLVKTAIQTILKEYHKIGINLFNELVGEQLEKNPILILLVFSKNLEEIRDLIKKNKKLAKEIVKTCGSGLKYVCKALKKEKDIVLEAVKNDGSALKYADISLLNNEDIVLTAVKSNWRAIMFVGEKLKNKDYVIIEAIKSGFMSIFYIDRKLLNSKHISALMDYHGDSLASLLTRDIQILDGDEVTRDIFELIKNDIELIRKIISINMNTIKLFPKIYLYDRTIIEKTLYKHEEIIKYMPNSLKNNKDMIINMIEYNPMVFKFIPMKYKRDKEIIKIVLSKNIGLLPYVPNHIRKNKEFMLRLLKF